MSSSSSAAESCASVSFSCLMVLTSIATAPVAFAIASRDTRAMSPVHLSSAFSVLLSSAPFSSQKDAI